MLCQNSNLIVIMSVIQNFINKSYLNFYMQWQIIVFPCSKTTRIWYDSVDAMDWYRCVDDIPDCMWYVSYLSHLSVVSCPTICCQPSSSCDSVSGDNKSIGYCSLARCQLATTGPPIWQHAAIGHLNILATCHSVSTTAASDVACAGGRADGDPARTRPG